MCCVLLRKLRNQPYSLVYAHRAKVEITEIVHFFSCFSQAQILVDLDEKYMI